MENLPKSKELLERLIALEPERVAEMERVANQISRDAFDRGDIETALQYQVTADFIASELAKHSKE